MQKPRCDYCGEWESDTLELCRCCNHCAECKLIASKHKGAAVPERSDKYKETMDKLRAFSEW